MALLDICLRDSSNISQEENRGNGGTLSDIVSRADTVMFESRGNGGTLLDITAEQKAIESLNKTIEISYTFQS